MLPTLIQHLLTPAAYPHPVRSIELLQTHISWVVLTGDYVYKLKKPICTSFLDYAELGKRRHYCHQEVALNGRYAPQLYLGVVPVGGPQQRPMVAAQTLLATDPPPDETQEFAVKMRQFPADALLSHRLREGRLTPHEVDAFAEQVARFHAVADRVDAASPWGTPARICDHAIDNLDHLQDAGAEAWSPQFAAGCTEPRSLPAEQLDHLRRWTLHTFDRLRDVLQGRRQAGRVRACHGDLHLANVIEWQGQIIPFDGIEFSESLRWIDVISDAAFAAMDFHARQHPGYAHRFLNAYFQAGQDYGGLRVLRWYRVYRALVRAKVAAMQASQTDGDPAERQHQQQKCLALIAQATDDTHPPPPSIVITHGVSGSGKTTGSQQLLEQRGAIRLRSDVVRKQMYGDHERQPAGAGVNSGIYSPEHTRQVYQRLAELTETVVGAGFPALVDATFLSRWQRDQFHDLARRLGVPLQVLSFSADADTLRSRLRQRQSSGSDASDADELILRHQLSTAEPLSDVERSLVVDWK